MMINMSLSSNDDASSSTFNLEGFFNQPSKYPKIALMMTVYNGLKSNTLRKVGFTP